MLGQNETNKVLNAGMLEVHHRHPQLLDDKLYTSLCYMLTGILNCRISKHDHAALASVSRHDFGLNLCAGMLVAARLTQAQAS